jgi:hypothetical protein
VSEAQIIGKPFVDHELAAKVQLALAGGLPRNVVQFRR